MVEGNAMEEGRAMALRGPPPLPPGSRRRGRERSARHRGEKGRERPTGDCRGGRRHSWSSRCGSAAPAPPARPARDAPRDAPREPPPPERERKRTPPRIRPCFASAPSPSQFHSHAMVPGQGGRRGAAVDLTVAAMEGGGRGWREAAATRCSKGSTTSCSESGSGAGSACTRSSTPPPPSRVGRWCRWICRGDKDRGRGEERPERER